MMNRTHSSRKSRGARSIKRISIVLAVMMVATVALSGCSAEDTASAAPLFEKIVSAIDDHYGEENSLAAALEQLGIDSEQIEHLEGVDDLLRVPVDYPVSIDGRDYQLFVHDYYGENRLCFVRLYTEIENDADVLPTMQNLFAEMEALYGEPLTNPALPNLLSEYVQNDELTVPPGKEFFAFSDYWNVIEDITGEANIDLTLDMTLYGRFTDSGGYAIEILYSVKYDRTQVKIGLGEHFVPPQA
jgi:hypothetical protein